MSRRRPTVLIYHFNARAYEAILSKRMPYVTFCAASKPEEASGVIEDVEVILSWRIPEELLKRARKLVWFASAGAGNERLIDNPHLPDSVILTRAAVYGKMMAEYVFGYILYLLRHGPKYGDDQEKRIWDPIQPDRLRDKTMGIIGLGSIGREIARRGKQFGMRVLGVRRNPEPVEAVDEVFGPNGLEKVIPLADYLVVVLPYTAQTHSFLREKELNLLREDAVLFNVGRGKTIDEQALIRILKIRRIRAVLDVFEEEPLSKGSELWGLKNVIITPHVSGFDAPEEICEGFIANYERWKRGKPLSDLVDRRRGY